MSFDGNEELVPENFGVLLLDKNQKMFESILSDLCSKDKVNIPRLYYQLLLENSQHAMLHERHIYEKRLAIQQMENLEPGNHQFAGSSTHNQFSYVETSNNDNAVQVRKQLRNRDCRRYLHPRLLVAEQSRKSVNYISSICSINA